MTGATRHVSPHQTEQILRRRRQRQSGAAHGYDRRRPEDLPHRNGGKRLADRGELGPLNRHHCQKITVRECDHQGQRGLTVQRQAWRRQALLLEQFAQLLLGLERDRCGRPFGAGQIFQRAG